MIDAMAIIICVITLIIAAVLAKFGLTLLRADPLEAEKNASRTRSFKDALLGRVQIHNDWLPDARVQGGMVYDQAQDRIEICGRVSDESLDRTFR